MQIRKWLVSRKHAFKYSGNLRVLNKEYPNNLGKYRFMKMTNSSKLEELNSDLEPFGFAYYPKQDIFYSIMDGWQRDCGYCELYDEGAAAFSMIIDCEPIRFEYGGRKWLIEFWKGQYGMTTGCEIGVYSTNGPNLNIPGFFDGTFYYTANDEDHLPISVVLKKNGTTMFSRSEVHWWLTGFRLGEFSDPAELSMNVEITLKNADMRDAFVDAFRETGYSDEEFSVFNNTVRFDFKQPHSSQPASRTFLIERFMQANNKRNCEAYRFATKHLYNPLDKLALVKIQAPKMYRKIMNVGDTKDLFKSFKTIQKFLDEHDKE